MAAEAEKVEGPYMVHDFTVADGSSGTNTEAMTLMKLSDPRTCAATDGDGDAFAGVLATEKVGGNGKTEIGCYTEGDFKLTAVAEIGDEGAIGAGDLVVVSGVNLIRKAEAADLLTGAVVGKAWEAIAAASQGEVHVGASV